MSIVAPLIANLVTLADLAPSADTDWPDAVDTTALVFYLAVILGLPALGYVFMYLDFRRWLLSLRRTLAVVAHAMPGTPYWAYRNRPGCLRAFDLSLPCTEEDVMAAYRRRVKSLHPDRGGDLEQFLRLQKHFEQALAVVRGQSGGASS